MLLLIACQSKDVAPGNIGLHTEEHEKEAAEQKFANTAVDSAISNPKPDLKSTPVVSRPISVSMMATDYDEYDMGLAMEEKRKRNTIIRTVHWEEGTVLFFEWLIDDPGREDIGCSNNRSRIVFKIQSGKDEYTLNADDLNSLGCFAEVMGGNLMKEGDMVSSARLELKKSTSSSWLVVGYIDVLMDDIHAGGQQAKRFVFKDTFTTR
jgi:hypothetical protein